mgnify:CR=1 FL=1
MVTPTTGAAKCRTYQHRSTSTGSRVSKARGGEAAGKVSPEAGTTNAVVTWACRACFLLVPVLVAHLPVPPPVLVLVLVLAALELILEVGGL